MSTVLLLDADIFCFQVASSVEKEIDWGDDLWTLHSDLGEAKARLHEVVDRLTEKLEAEEVLLCFTDSVNFRKSVFPDYKGNRKSVRKPLAYKELVQYAKDTFETFTRPGLEADDVMGILATWPAFRPGKKVVIVSEDKDLKTIAGAWLFNPAKHDKPVFNEPEEADRYFLEQTLSGDATDGYPGCPGIGPDTAKEILAAPFVWEQYEHEFKSGPRKGTTELRWRKADIAATPWESIVSHYKKAGLNETVAIQQARCARILRSSDYDFKRKEPILWTPPSPTPSSPTTP